MTGDVAWFVPIGMATGAITGLLAGLIGIGGGLILVPVLFELMLRLDAAPAIAMRGAIATSLACVVATGVRSAVSHHRLGSFDPALVRLWAPGMVLGSLAGAEMAIRLDASILVTAFACVTIALAANMAFGREHAAGTPLPAPVWRHASGGIVGLVAGLLGLGVAGLGVPLMSRFEASVRAAVAAAALIGALAAALAVLRFVAAGLPVPGLPPWSVGYVNVLGFALIVPVALLVAPLGAAWSHRVSVLILKRIFAGFLVVNAIRMLFG